MSETPTGSIAADASAVHETTAGQIGISIVALLEHPDQFALLRDAEDPKVIATAVEELLRYVSIIQTGQRRIADEDIEVDGELIRAGEGIILDVAPANWDARRFPEPDRLDLRRDDGPHVGFGYGRHQCVGQQLARMELQIVLPHFSGAFPCCGWRCRSMSCPSSTTRSRTDSTSCRSRGE